MKGLPAHRLPARTMPAWLLVFLLTATASFAVAQPGPEDQPATSQPFLWEVNGPNGSTHLFGTIHLGVSITEVDPIVLERLDSSHTLYVETDIRAINPFSLMSMAMLPAGESLRDLLGEESWEQLDEMFGATFPVEMLSQLQPWLVTTLIQASELPLSDPMDMAILGRAEDQGSTLGFYEDWEWQMGMMNDVPLEYSVEDLQDALANPEVMREELDELIEMYRAGDGKGIHAMMFDPAELEDRPEFYEITLYNRNMNWLPSVTESADQGGVFIAVGLGHMLGEDGLVHLLRQLGYEVTRLGGE